MSTSLTSSAEFYIRPAVEADAESILHLIKDLAIYEKSEDSVEATSELIRQNIFRTPYAHALLAFRSNPSVELEQAPGRDADDTLSGGDAIGLALYFFNYSTWTGRPGLYLEDLYVSPEHRNKGVGKAFFGELGKIAKEKNCARLDWAVLTWNEPSIAFYEQVLGAKQMSEWAGMRLEEEGIEALKRFRLGHS